MSEKYKPQKGDRVRVVLEGEVCSVRNGAIFLKTNKGTGEHKISDGSDLLVSIEKIEPPVEVFKPGDVLRGLGLRDLYVAVTKDGWVHLGSGTHHPGGGRYDFTSKHYERVNLS